MHVQLPPPLEKYVRDQIAAGRYPNESAVVNEAIEQMMEQEEFTPEQDARYRQALDQAFKEERAGLARPWDVTSLLRERKQKKGA